MDIDFKHELVLNMIHYGYCTYFESVQDKQEHIKKDFMHQLKVWHYGLVLAERVSVTGKCYRTD